MFLEKILKSLKKNSLKALEEITDIIPLKDIVIDTRKILTNLDMFEVENDLPDRLAISVKMKKNYISTPKSVKLFCKNKMTSVKFYDNTINSSQVRDILLERSSCIKSIDLIFSNLECMYFGNKRELNHKNEILPLLVGDVIINKNFGYVSEDLEIAYEENQYKQLVLSGTDISSPLIPYGGFSCANSSPSNIKQTFALMTSNRIKSKQLLFLTRDDILEYTRGTVDLRTNFIFNKTVYGYVNDFDFHLGDSLGEFIENGGIDIAVNSNVRYVSSQYSFDVSDPETIKVILNRRENV